MNHDKILLDDLAEDAKLLINRVMQLYSPEVWESSFELVSLGGRIETRISLRESSVISFRLLAIDADGVEVPLFILDDHKLIQAAPERQKGGAG